MRALTRIALRHPHHSAVPDVHILLERRADHCRRGAIQPLRQARLSILKPCDPASSRRRCPSVTESRHEELKAVIRHWCHRSYCAPRIAFWVTSTLTATRILVQLYVVSQPRLPSRYLRGHSPARHIRVTTADITDGIRITRIGVITAAVWAIAAFTVTCTGPAV